MPELDDAILERQLRRSLQLHLDALTLDLDAAAIEARRGAARRSRASRRRWLVLGLAAALALPAAWLLVGAPLPDIARSGTYQAILTRQTGTTNGGAEFDVIAVRVDGKERQIGHLPRKLDEVYRVEGVESMSQSGWLGVWISDSRDPSLVGWAFVDLRHGGSVAPFKVMASPTDVAIGWGPTGRFAVQTDNDIGVTDPVTGSVVRVPHGGVPGTTIVWLADGSGFLAHVNPTTDADGTIRPGGSSVIRLDGSRSAVGSAEPDLSVATPRLGPDGAVLAMCGRISLQSLCRGKPMTLTRQVGDGAPETWLTSLPPGRRLSSAIFAHDGSTLILVDDVSSDRRLRVERLVRPDTMVDVASVGATPGLDVATIVGRAADGSLIALDASRDDGEQETIIVPTDGRPGTYHHGVSLGFLRSDVADAIPGASFEMTADAIAPTIGAAPHVRSEAEVSAQVTSGTIVGTAEDPGDPTGRRTTRDLGTLTFVYGAGASISCVGLGTVDVEFAGSGITADCFLGTVTAGSGEDRLTVPVKVVADQGAAWRVVIYDAASPGTSP